MKDQVNRKRPREVDDHMAEMVAPADFSGGKGENRTKPQQRSASATPYGSRGTPSSGRRVDPRVGQPMQRSHADGRVGGSDNVALSGSGTGRPSSDFRTPNRLIVESSSQQTTAKPDRGMQRTPASSAGPKSRPSIQSTPLAGQVHTAGNVNALKEVSPFALLREEMRLFDLVLHVRHRARVYRHHRWFSWSNKVWAICQRIFFPQQQSSTKTNPRSYVGLSVATPRVAGATPATQKVKGATTPPSRVVPQSPLSNSETARGLVGCDPTLATKPKKDKVLSSPAQLLRHIEHASTLVAAELRLQRLDTIPICIALFSILARLHYLVAVVKIPFGPIPKKEDLQSTATSGTPHSSGGGGGTASIPTLDLAFARPNEAILSAVSRTAANSTLANMLEAASRLL